MRNVYSPPEGGLCQYWSGYGLVVDGLVVDDSSSASAKWFKEVFVV